jgi:hypothetical protein
MAARGGHAQARRTTFASDASRAIRILDQRAELEEGVSQRALKLGRLGHTQVLLAGKPQEILQAPKWQRCQMRETLGYQLTKQSANVANKHGAPSRQGNQRVGSHAQIRCRKVAGQQHPLEVRKGLLPSCDHLHGQEHAAGFGNFVHASHTQSRKVSLRPRATSGSSLSSEHVFWSL